jgi:hypothetical protein
VSSSKQTKHIKAKYFLIKVYDNSGEIDLHYRPTDVMWADVLTKQLQGLKFRDMCEFLQNCSPDSDNDIKLRTDKLARRLMNQQVKTVASPRECVGELANLTGEKMRKRRQSPTCVPRIGESLEIPGSRQKGTNNDVGSRKKGTNSYAVSKQKGTNNDAGSRKKREVSGKILCRDTQELVDDHRVNRWSVHWA